MITATPGPKKGTNWTQRFMELAAHIATWSKDPSTKVGAVIVDKKRRVIGLGYNGFPRGVSDSKDRYEHRPTKYKLVVHSEANAILNANANRSVEGCTLYTTKFPCTDCTKLIIQSGIAEVVTPVAPEGDRAWTEDAEVSKVMMLEAEVTITLLEPAA
jgi:dCMP deaminase